MYLLNLCILIWAMTNSSTLYRIVQVYYTVNPAAQCCPVNLPTSCNAVLGPPSGLRPRHSCRRPDLDSIVHHGHCGPGHRARHARHDRRAHRGQDCGCSAVGWAAGQESCASKFSWERAWGSTKFIQIPNHNKCHHKSSYMQVIRSKNISRI